MGQSLLKAKYTQISGLQPAVLSQKYALLPQPDEFLQILNVNGNRWILISTIGCPPATVNVYCMELYLLLRSVWLPIYFSAKNHVLRLDTWMFNGRATDMIVGCLLSLMQLHCVLEPSQPLSHLNNQKCVSIFGHAWRRIA